MNDPFQTLGVSSTATEDEIKAAYRKMAKKYHPDLHPDDPVTAEKKMKEINEAYAEAMRIKKGGSGAGWDQGSGYQSYGQQQGGYQSYGQQQGGNPFGYGYQQDDQRSGFNPYGFGFGFGPFGFGGFEQRSGTFSVGQYDDAELQAAADDIRAGRHQSALQLLQRMSAHDAPWHYLCALAHRGLGNTLEALNHSRQAVRMDPDKAEYQTLLNSLQGYSGNYRRSAGQQGSIFANPYALCCLGTMLCNCCGGGRLGYFLCC